MGRALHTHVRYMPTKFSGRKPKGKRPAERPGHGWEDITLWFEGSCDLGKLDLTDLIGPVTSSHEHNNESVSSIKCRKFDEQLLQELFGTNMSDYIQEYWQYLWMDFIHIGPKQYLQ